ncbi:MAG: CDP-alcohol phosphatidyltransferase family protein [Candidatus Gastranaerophilaceae bacterium]
MANFITIFRILLVFISISLLFSHNSYAYICAIVLTVIAFSLDGVDGYIARKFNETSKLGAVLDIMSDRIVENTFWVTFAVLGWLPVAYPIVALTRGFVVDGLRSVAMEQGYTAFGDLTMQEGKFSYFICCSKFSRITYAVSKLVAFGLMIVAKAPGLYFLSRWHWYLNITADLAAFIAIEFCVIRALPVLFESKKFFKKQEKVIEKI